MNYYQKQLDRLVDLNTVNVQLSDYQGNKTNNMSLNIESMETLEKFFKQYKKILKSKQQATDENNNKEK